jgi:glycosyltransferase involved in cell wall biosynthesis
LVAPFWKEFDAAILDDEIKYISHLAIILAARLRRRSVVYWGFGYPSGTMRQEGPMMPGQSINNSLRTMFRQTIVRFVDGHLAYTRLGAESLAKGGMPRSRIVTVRNTVNIEQEFGLRAIAEREDETELRQDPGASARVPILLYFGRYLPEKRVDLLIEYAKFSAERGRNVCIVLSGAGVGRDRLFARAGASNIVFQSLVGLALARALRSTSAVVIPEFSGLAITHAFAHGAPFITREGIVHSPEIEYLIDGENGLLLPHEEGAFVAALDRYLDEAVAKFDPGFGRTGSEDMEFFCRVQQKGASIVEEVVPIERVTRGYLSGRARQMEQVEVQKARLGLDDDSISLKVTLVILVVLLLWTHPILRPRGSRMSYKTFAMFCYSIGII